MTITPEDLVRREVCYCASSLIYTLATCHGDGQSGELDRLTEQAFELSCPVLDERQAEADGVEDLEAVIDEYEREVFEHWIVSDWLADKLEAKGEKVEKDFAGLTIWARTTTGQAIALDAVIEEICADLNT